MAANYFVQTGLPPDNCYPYTGTDGSCSAACAGWQTSTEKLLDWVYLGASPSVDTIKNALNNYGPLVTAMAVYSDFFSYRTGVYHYVSGGLAGGHAVLIVGYDDVNQCFIVKNSWGTGWGEQTFFRIAYSEMSSPTQFGYDTIAYEMASRGCSYTAKVEQTGNFPGYATNGIMSVTTTSDCSWTAVSQSFFLKITYGGTGTGNGIAYFSLDANTTGVVRTGYLKVGDQNVLITQDPQNTCAYTLNPVQKSFGVAGGSASIGVTSGQNCPWTATSNTSWITITSGASGTGNGTVAYSVAANTSSTSRTGQITVGGKTFTVTQDGAGTCTYTLSPTSQSQTSASGAGSVSVTAGSGCAWTAVSNATSWLTVTSGSNGTGNGTVGYSAAANTTTSTRSGTLTVASQTFTVNQAAAACMYSISPTSSSFTAAADTGSVAVTSASGCAWTATSNASSWLTITSGASGAGNGSVGYSAAANASGSSRTGTLTIGGQSFSVTQAGQSCSYYVSPSGQSYTAAGGTGSANISAISGCPWTATTSACWISIASGATGSGSGAVGYSVTNNTGASVRQGTMTIAGSTFTVTQTGLSCDYTVTPVNQSLAGAGGTGSASVSAPSGCPWTATSTAPFWLTITSGASGSGNGTVNYTVSTNTTGVRRSAIMTIGGNTSSYVSIVQSALSCSYSITPVSQSYTAAAGTGSVSVISASGCPWTASSNASWISLTSGASGSGSGTVGYSMTANTTTSTRSGTLTVVGQTFTVSQAAASCTYAISPASQSLGSGTGTGSINVTSASGCAWTASSNASWISITSGARQERYLVQSVT